MRVNEVRTGSLSLPGTDLVRLVIIAVLAILCIATSAASFASGILAIITSQLFFIPIIYAAYVSPRKGLYVAATCSLAYQTIGYFYSFPSPVSLVSITGEAILFIVIAAIIAYFMERIQSGELKYRTVFENSQLGILLFNDADFSIKQSNEKFAAMLNYTVDEVMTKFLLDMFLSPREKSRFLERFGKEKTTSDFETRLAAKDGSSCWVNLSWGQISVGTVSCSVVNINARKLAEKLNNDNMMKYRQLTEGSPTSILIVQNGFIRFANPSFVAFVEYSPAEITGKSLSAFIEPGNLDDFNKFSEKWAQKYPAKHAKEFRFVSKTGEVKVGSLFTNQVIHMGNPATLVNIVDITEKQRLEDQIHKDNERRRGVIVTVAHELRTPLQPILGYLNLLLSDADGFGIKEDTKKILERCLTSVDRERQIINQMLDLSVLESGKLQLTTSTFPLAPLVRNVLDAGEFAAKAELTVNIEDSIQVTGDKERLFSVLDSLLSNAVNFSKPPRKIGIFYRSAVGDRQHHISIRDNGVGIPQDQFSSIFEPFQLADGTVLSRKYERLGLSLSIAKNIVQMHGGSISVESVVNAGSTFTIHLPKEEIHHDA
ncbi:PAS domain-containing sensor histidine kinase [Methanoregula sp.]|uniref:PAS domain-containing sensor histidine kinase n=1 Tax=Methanoregula sp. TaxID=2052170 RepID=UPI002616D913|nr:PAS domain-containing sensor histidine kinase [Methanoregula sp.]MDD5142901.1 PAS domain-containing sensor histidine kinase [Methanoregula sp.]